jgi:branched-chain amino acid transport system substrate-binding protein
MRKKTLFVALLVTLLFVAFHGQSNVLWGAEPYIIGYIADMTGPCRSFYGPEGEACRLYVEVLNSKGGVNGHPIKFVFEDGKSDPARSGAIAKKMIERDNVLGIWGLGISASHPPVLELASKERVAVVCGYSTIQNVASVKPNSSVVFPTGFTMHPEYHNGGYAYAQVIKKYYPKSAKVAVGGYASPGGRVWYIWTKELAEKWGYKVLSESAIPPGTIDLSPWVNELAKVNPDIFTVAVGGEVMIPLIPQLEKAGWTKDILMPYGVIEGDVVKARERLVGNGEWMLWLSRYSSSFDIDTVPELREIKKAMDKYGHQFPLSAEHANGWTMGRLMEAGLKKAGWPCSRANLVSALEKTELDTLGLSGGPIRFTSTDHQGPAWFKLYRWNDAKKALVPVGNWFKVESEWVKRKE